MPSPFPGMDPLIESMNDCWMEFHSHFVIAIAEVLVPRVRPNYEVRAERQVYITDDEEALMFQIRPDVHIADAGHGWRDYARAGEATLDAHRRTVLLEEPQEQTFLKIIDGSDRRVVTVIELLSPTNKAAGNGSLSYLQKRIHVGRTRTNLVELDLLRGGKRLPTTEPLPPTDFAAYVSRAGEFPDADVYVWTLRDLLPTIPIPLRGMDPDVGLDLQSLFDDVYDRTGYDYMLKYDHPIHPPLSDADATWAADILARRQPPAWMQRQETPS
ncbi:MAG: DUF4058 family protein [Planctomycetaceae bacterium]|nr:DUF4058 family protein [Planctomycetaceae bacterium]